MGFRLATLIRAHWIVPLIIGVLEFAFMIVSLICGLYFTPWGSAEWVSYPLWIVLVISAFSLKLLFISTLYQGVYPAINKYITSLIWCVLATIVFYFVFKCTIGLFLFTSGEQSGMRLWSIVISFCMLLAYPYFVYGSKLNGPS